MNYIEITKKQAEEIIIKSYQTAVEKGIFEQVDLGEIIIEVPKDTKNGDFATSFALKSAKLLRGKPQDIANKIIENCDLENTYFNKVTIAGPGFINFTLSNKMYEEVVKTAISMGRDYGKTDGLKGQKIMVEFVSANPTGPMHMGNARGGVLGDCLAEVLSLCGADVTREFLINDAGNQVKKLGLSLNARFIQILKGDDAIIFPEDGYQGGDIRELAQKFIDINGDGLLEKLKSNVVKL